MLFLQALTLEQQDGINRYFRDKMALVRSSVEDRFELLMNTDVEQISELQNVWQ